MSRVSRRDFLKLVGSGSVGAGAGFVLAEAAKRPVEQYIPYVVTPEDYSPGIATWYHSVCAQCMAGCGVSVRVREGRAKKIEGNPSHPVSQGRLCALGQAGLNVLYNPDRLQTPLRRTGDKGSGTFEPITWDEALAALSERLAPGGADTQLLTGAVRGHLHSLIELFVAAVGVRRYLQYEALGLEAEYAAHRVAFGTDLLPYPDLRNAELVVSFGADVLGTGPSPVHHGLAYGHFRRGAGRARGQFVQIEPRLSLTGANADTWLPARPGTEALIALALARELVARGRYQGEDRAEWERLLAPYAFGEVAERCGVDAQRIVVLGEAFVTSPRPLAIGGGAAASGTNGGATMLAVDALNFLAGNLGQVGGLLGNPAPAIANGRERRGGFSALQELLADAAGRTLIVSGTNPAFAMPMATKARAALLGVDMLVSVSAFMDETTALADLVLPADSYLEAWGDDVPEPGVGFPVAAIAQPVVARLYETLSLGDVLLALAARIGGEVARALPWPDMQSHLKHAWAQLYESRRAQLAQPSFAAFWTEVLRAGVWGEARTEPAAPAADVGALRAAVAYQAPEMAGDAELYPFLLQPYASIAFRDGRGANQPWMQELPDPLTSIVYGSWVELHPETARSLDLREGDLVEVRSAHGTLTAPVFVYPGIRPEVVAMPIGQGHAQYGRYAGGRGANPLEILAPLTDHLSGALALGATRIGLHKLGRRLELAKTDGVTRTLGRQILHRGEQHGV